MGGACQWGTRLFACVLTVCIGLLPAPSRSKDTKNKRETIFFPSVLHQYHKRPMWSRSQCKKVTVSAERWSCILSLIHLTNTPTQKQTYTHRLMGHLAGLVPAPEAMGVAAWLIRMWSKGCGGCELPARCGGHRSGRPFQWWAWRKRSEDVGSDQSGPDQSACWRLRPSPGWQMALLTVLHIRMGVVWLSNTSFWWRIFISLWCHQQVTVWGGSRRGHNDVTWSPCRVMVMSGGYNEVTDSDHSSSYFCYSSWAASFQCSARQHVGNTCTWRTSCSPSCSEPREPLLLREFVILLVSVLFNNL